MEGWGPWSVKDGITYAHAPAAAVEKVAALRLHLDDSNLDKGPLRVLPKTHESGVLTDEEIHKFSEIIQAVDCPVPKGGVVAMRPLVDTRVFKIRNGRASPGAPYRVCSQSRDTAGNGASDCIAQRLSRPSGRGRWRSH